MLLFSASKQLPNSLPVNIGRLRLGANSFRRRLFRCQLFQAPLVLAPIDRAPNSVVHHPRLGLALLLPWLTLTLPKPSFTTFLLVFFTVSLFNIIKTCFLKSHQISLKKIQNQMNKLIYVKCNAKNDNNQEVVIFLNKVAYNYHLRLIV